MNVTTLPRTAARLEYAALRMPLTILERRIFVPFVAEEASARLSFEMALG
jgi:hypothetical protein